MKSEQYSSNLGAIVGFCFYFFHITFAIVFLLAAFEAVSKALAY